MNNNPHKEWENLFEQLPLESKPHDEHREALKARVLDAFDSNTPVAASEQDSTCPNPSGLSKIGRLLMRYKAPYWTAAAILIGSLAWLVQGPNTAVAFEELVSRVINCRTARYDMEFEVDGKPQVTQHLYMAPGRSRVESGGFGFQINDAVSGKSMTLNPTDKTAQVITLTNRSESKQDATNMFEKMRDAIRLASQDDIKKLDGKVIDGRKTTGFRISSKIDKAVEITIWADPATHFPVQIEMDPRIVEGVGPMVMKNYEFNIELDESLFSMEVPKGYTLRTATANMTTPQEADFVRCLEKYASVMDKLPSGLAPTSLPKDVMAYVEKIGVAPDQLQQVMLDMTLPMLVFPASLTPAAEVKYTPENFVAADGTKPIFSYKPDGSDQYRVVYSDFTVKNAPEPPN